MVKRISNDTLIRETMTFEFESDSERREFIRHLNSFGKSAVVVDRTDGSQRVVKSFTDVTSGREFASMREFLVFMVGLYDETGASLGQILKHSRELGYFLKQASVAAQLRDLHDEGKLERAGTRGKYVYHIPYTGKVGLQHE